MKTIRIVIPLLLVFTLLLSACAQTSVPATGSDVLDVPIEVTETGITVPAQVTPGLVNFNISSSAGLEGQEVDVVRLNTGVTLEQFQETLREDDLAAVSLVAIVGGRDLAASQNSNFSTVLQEGTHVVLVFAPEAEAPPLIGTFQVSGEARPTTDLPEADVTVDMVDFNFVMPETLPAGQSTWEITNSGTQWHHMVLVRPNEGVTEQQILEMMQSGEEPQGPPPWEQVGYFGPQTQGERAWINLDLSPGTYIAMCFLPDVNTGESHLAKGMIRTIQVGE